MSRLPDNQWGSGGQAPSPQAGSGEWTGISRTSFTGSSGTAAGAGQNNLSVLQQLQSNPAAAMLLRQLLSSPPQSSLQQNMDPPRQGRDQQQEAALQGFIASSLQQQNLPSSSQNQLPQQASMSGQSNTFPTFCQPTTQQFQPLQLNQHAGAGVASNTQPITIPDISKVKEPVSVAPCKARRMPPDHNAINAFFEIPADAGHGQTLVCSYPACRDSGIKFLYCKYCRTPAARRSFRQFHSHLDQIEGPGVADADNKKGELLPEDSSTSARQDPNTSEAKTESSSEPKDDKISVGTLTTEGRRSGEQDYNQKKKVPSSTPSVTLSLSKRQLEWLRLFDLRPANNSAEALDEWLLKALECSEQRKKKKVAKKHPKKNTAAPYKSQELEGNGTSGESTANKWTDGSDISSLQDAQQSSSAGKGRTYDSTTESSSGSPGANEDSSGSANESGSTNETSSENESDTSQSRDSSSGEGSFPSRNSSSSVSADRKYAPKTTESRSDTEKRFGVRCLVSGSSSGRSNGQLNSSSESQQSVSAQGANTAEGNSNNSSSSEVADSSGGNGSSSNGEDSEGGGQPSDSCDRASLSSNVSSRESGDDDEGPSKEPAMDCSSDSGLGHGKKRPRPSQELQTPIPKQRKMQ